MTLVNAPRATRLLFSTTNVAIILHIFFPCANALHMLNNYCNGRVIFISRYRKSNFEVLLNELWNNFLKSDVVIPNRNDEKIENVSGILICSKVKFIISQVNIWASHWTSADCMLVTGCSSIEIPKKYATKHSICHSCYFRPLKKLIHATFSKQTSCLGLPPWHLACLNKTSIFFIRWTQKGVRA